MQQDVSELSRAEKVSVGNELEIGAGATATTPLGKAHPKFGGGRTRSTLGLQSVVFIDEVDG